MLPFGLSSAPYIFTKVLRPHFFKSSLRDAGFAINSSKSNWDPVHSLVWLGLEWDLVAASFRVTQKRIEFF